MQDKQDNVVQTPSSCAIQITGNDKKCGYIFMFSKITSEHELPRMQPGAVITHSIAIKESQ